MDLENSKLSTSTTSGSIKNIVSFNLTVCAGWAGKLLGFFTTFIYTKAYYLD